MAVCPAQERKAAQSQKWCRDSNAHVLLRTVFAMSFISSSVHLTMKIHGHSPTLGVSYLQGCRTCWGNFRSRRDRTFEATDTIEALPSMPSILKTWKTPQAQQTPKTLKPYTLRVLNPSFKRDPSIVNLSALPRENFWVN